MGKLAVGYPGDANRQLWLEQPFVRTPLESTEINGKRLSGLWVRLGITEFLL